MCGIIWAKVSHTRQVCFINGAGRSSTDTRVKGQQLAHNEVNRARRNAKEIPADVRSARLPGYNDRPELSLSPAGVYERKRERDKCTRLNTKNCRSFAARQQTVRLYSMDQGR